MGYLLASCFRCFLLAAVLRAASIIIKWRFLLRDSTVFAPVETDRVAACCAADVANLLTPRVVIGDVLVEAAEGGGRASAALLEDASSLKMTELEGCILEGFSERPINPHLSLHRSKHSCGVRRSMLVLILDEFNASVTSRQFDG